MENKKKKGQVSMEIMVYMGFFMLVFVFVLLFLLSDFNTDISRREFILTKQTAGQVADYTEFISKAGPGFWANFSIPQRLNGRKYNARFVSSGWLYIDVEGDSRMSFSYPTGHSNIKAGWSAADNLPDNSYRTYVDTEGIDRYEASVDGSKGWIAFNYTRDLSGNPVLLVK